MLKGIDVSQWQSAINWPQVKADGYAFTMIKATEGLFGVDPDFTANWAGAKAAGLIRGSYCFTRPEAGNPVGQAAHFVQTVGTLDPGDLLAGDFETPGSTADESAFALAWLGAVRTAAGFPPLAYMSQSWASSRMADARLAAYPLWLACLDPQVCPARIGVWPSVALQQYSWTLSVPGISGNVDGDELARTLDGLKALGKPAPKPAPKSLVWHIRQTCALKPEPTASHTTGSVHTCFGGDIVVKTGHEQTWPNPIAHKPETWVEVLVTPRNGGAPIQGFVVSTNLYST